MRQIEFRGKCLDNGEWVYGYYVENKLGNHFIYEIERNGEFVWRDPSTIGQFTGLVDKNGKKIYEGDKLNVIFSKLDGEVSSWKTPIKNILDFDIMRDLCYANELEVISNIHDKENKRCQIMEYKMD